MKKYLLLIIFCTSIALTACKAEDSYSEYGMIIGVVTKISREGIFNKTDEGELIIGGLTNGGGGFSAYPFRFTFSNSDDVKKATIAMGLQQTIVIRYHRDIFSYFFSSNRGYFADSIVVFRNTGAMKV